MNNFVHAARPILYDLLGVIAFAVLTALHVDLMVSVGAAALIAVAVVAWQVARGKPVAALQWVSLALVLASAAASFVTHDARFVMAKPTVVYLAVGWAMLERGWMNRYIPPIAVGKVEPVMDRFGYVWAGLMFVLAAANLVVAVWFSSRWAAFTGIVPLAANIVLFGVQYAVVRRVARAAIVAERAASAARA